MKNYVPTTAEIRGAVILHRAPLIWRKHLGITIMQAEQIAAQQFDAWFESLIGEETDV